MKQYYRRNTLTTWTAQTVTWGCQPSTNKNAVYTTDRKSATSSNTKQNKFQMHCSDINWDSAYITVHYLFFLKKRMIITVISQVLYPSRILFLPHNQTLKLADKWCNGIITWEGLIHTRAPHATGDTSQNSTQTFLFIFILNFLQNTVTTNEVRGVS